MIVLIGLLGVVLLFGLGFSVSQVLKLSDELSLLRNEVATIRVSNSNSTQTSITSDLKIGVIRVDILLARYQEENQNVKAQLAQELSRIQNEINHVQQQMDSGSLSSADAQTQLLALRTEWDDAGLNLVARPFQEAVNTYGIDGPYEIILKVEDVVLFGKNNALVDITDEVWQIMKNL
jgi:hypothetical protein